MNNQGLLESLLGTISEILPDKPGEEIRNNLRAALQATLARLEIVTREEFETQQMVLARTREKLEALEKIVAELEQSGTVR